VANNVVSNYFNSVSAACENVTAFECTLSLVISWRHFLPDFLCIEYIIHFFQCEVLTFLIIEGKISLMQKFKSLQHNFLSQNVFSKILTFPSAVYQR